MLGMRCTSTYGEARCSLEHGHGPLHMGEGGQPVWSELELEDFEDGFEILVEEEEDPNGAVVNVVQHYVPYSYVVITRRPISKKQRACKRCAATGLVSDPYTAEMGPCPSCQPLAT